MIRSVYYDQVDILKSIMELCSIERFCVDVTYGNGSFYKKIPHPHFCFDLDAGVIGPAKVPSDSVKGVASSDDLPLGDEVVGSLVFDPPFLTYVKAAREHNSVMAKRFGGYWRYDELEDHYRKTIIEAHRVLYKKGVMVIKCQDIIHNHKMHCTHANIINWMDGIFRLKDLFILAAKNRMTIPEKKGEKKRVQKHARIFHSYFMVLEKI